MAGSSLHPKQIVPISALRRLAVLVSETLAIFSWEDGFLGSLWYIHSTSDEISANSVHV